MLLYLPFVVLPSSSHPLEGAIHPECVIYGESPLGLLTQNANFSLPKNKIVSSPMNLKVFRHK